MADEIHELLDSYHSATLFQMAEAAGMDTMRGSQKLRKGELLTKMQAEYFRPERILAAWEELGQREKQVVVRLLLRNGKTSTNRFRRELRRAGITTNPQPGTKTPFPQAPYVDDYEGDPLRRKSAIFEDIIARLTLHGLVFSAGSHNSFYATSYKMQFHPGAELFIPDFVRRHLPEPKPIQQGMPDFQPDRVGSGEPSVLLRDLYLYWDFVRRSQVSIIQSGLVGKRSLKAINKILLLPDQQLEKASREDQTGRLYLLRQMLDALALVKVRRNKLAAASADPVQIPAFWSWSLAEQASACLEAWAMVDGVGGLAREAERYYPRYVNARSVMLKVLQALPAGVWLSPSDVLDAVQEQDADFLFADHSRVENSRDRWYYGYRSGTYYGSSRKLLQEFEKYERKFVYACLTGFLNQIGLVELGYQSDSLAAVRIVRQLAVGVNGDQGSLVIQPNFNLLAMGPISLATLAHLDLFAERQNTDRGVFEYHLSRESLYQAQQIGYEPAAVMEFLAQHSDTDLPQNVRRSLEEWAAHAERIVFRSQIDLLQAADAQLLADLMDGPHTGKHLGRTVSSTVAVLKKGVGRQLLDALVSQGLFPAISGADPEAADDSVLVQPDGRIQLVHAVPSLHLRGRLNRLAEETVEGHWQLTPESLRRAGGSRNKVLRVLEELKKLHCGPFPAELEQKLKAWGAYYGDAAVDTLTLLRFRDRTALDELRQHPELKDRLTPFPAGTQTGAFAVVELDDLEAVRQILARFGVDVRQGL